MYHVYILKCNDETLYVGSTNDVDKRLYQHNNLKSGAHYTKIRRPVLLLYKEEYTTLKESRAREAEIKRYTRKEKLELTDKKSIIKDMNTETKISHENDPLYGKTLKSIVEFLYAKYGWVELGKMIKIKSFNDNPSIESSLKFLRKTDWARKEVEELYIASSRH